MKEMNKNKYGRKEKEKKNDKKRIREAKRFPRRCDGRTRGSIVLFAPQRILRVPLGFPGLGGLFLIIADRSLRRDKTWMTGRPRELRQSETWSTSNVHPEGCVNAPLTDQTRPPGYYHTLVSSCTFFFEVPYREEMALLLGETAFLLEASVYSLSPPPHPCYRRNGFLVLIKASVESAVPLRFAFSRESYVLFHLKGFLIDPLHTI
ncbi:unnamed protein product [Nezara viridula]|uniref:Uncharacterized protein n=1 Tax=Nezara viridula TaxID=85310 RepID=A0A9P0HEY9_NEZVI|nr:unnamed protein product [Nezara viridula]